MKQLLSEVLPRKEKPNEAALTCAGVCVAAVHEEPNPPSSMVTSGAESGSTALRVPLESVIAGNGISSSYLNVWQFCNWAWENHVPVGARVSRALMRYRTVQRPGDTGCDSFFLTRDGQPLVKRRVQCFIREYGRIAGIKTRCSPHTFRSSSAVLYLRAGGDPFTLQKKLGHSSLTMTRRYSELADSDVRAAHLRYSPVDRLCA